ncbi:NAD(P)-binding protein [Byssothecium circinans]|uniref:NAD(P)-binding protein n=1 Tax=Byssothecium circinans TaxID=147558 RepID=A0A6A5TY79_9PLEO|nr:NAD(P)-binding protein [Byssothecium circinans]
MASESPIPRKVLLFGSTGVIRKFILQALIDEKASFEKIGIFTSQGTAEKKKDVLDRVKAEGVEVVVGDVNSEADIAKAYEGFDTVISALGRNVILTQIALLDIIKLLLEIQEFFLGCWRKWPNVLEIAILRMGDEYSRRILHLERGLGSHDKSMQGVDEEGRRKMGESSNLYAVCDLNQASIYKLGPHGPPSTRDGRNSNLLDIAERSSTIHTFYPSEYGTDIEYSPTSSTEPPHQLKLKVRAHIRTNIKKLHITYLVTGPYSDLYFGKLPGKAGEVGSFNPKEHKAVLLGSGDDKVSFTSMADVGKLLVAALKVPAKEKERTLKVNSFTTTPHEILKEFERQTEAKWEVKYTSLDALKKGRKEDWEKGDPLATVYTLRRIWTEGGTLYEKRDNGKIGDPGMETLENQVKKAVEKEIVGS